MRALITVLIFGLMVIYVGQFKVSFSPFKIVWQKPLESIGLLCMIIAFACFRHQSEKDGFKKGVATTMAAARKIISEERAKNRE